MAAEQSETAPLAGEAKADYKTDGHGHSHGESTGHSHAEKKEPGHGHSHGTCAGHGEKKEAGHSHAEKHSGGHSHDHDHGHDHGGHGHSHASSTFGVGEEKVEDERRAREKLALKACIGLCFVFMIVEVIFGYIANSLAIMTDAAHLFTDVASLGLALWSIKAAERPVDYKKMQGKGGAQQLTFGWHRVEVLGTLGSIASIWFLTAVIIWEAFQRLIVFSRCAIGISDIEVRNELCYGVDGKIMCFIGSFGLVVNLAMAGILKLGGDPKVQHAHSHDGGEHDHGHGHGGGGCGGHGESVNVEGAFLHALSDCLNSVGVIIAAIVIWVGNSHEFGKDQSPYSWYNLADPACSFLFGAITIRTTYGLAREVTDILMEACPPGINYYEVLTDITSLPGVIEVHDLHIWSLTREARSLSVHVTAGNEEEDSSQIMRNVLRRVQNLLASKYEITHSTVQVEVAEDSCTTKISQVHGKVHSVTPHEVSQAQETPTEEVCY